MLKNQQNGTVFLWVVKGVCNNELLLKFILSILPTLINYALFSQELLLLLLYFFLLFSFLVINNLFFVVHFVCNLSTYMYSVSIITLEDKDIMSAVLCVNLYLFFILSLLKKVFILLFVNVYQALFISC